MPAPPGNQYAVGYGRPTKYEGEKTDARVRRMYLLGLTDEQVADFLGVALQTLYLWREEHKSFLEATEDGKHNADAAVAESLYKRATGFERKEAVKIFAPNFGEGGTGEPTYAPFTEYYPPDTNAASLWLRNRQPRLWRDKQEHELTGKDGGPLVASPIVVQFVDPGAKDPGESDPETG